MTSTSTDPVLGRCLDGRYRVDAQVARGGMATVYRALDLRLDRSVAVKVLHPVLADDADFVARFHREAQAAAALAHPDAVAVFDQGVDAGQVFLVMEYVAGGTLRDLLRERGALRPTEAVAVIVPVLRALAAAHNRGLVHCDVKPENVLLSRDGQVKVGDFGLVRAVAPATTRTTIGLLIGTVGYLAPEQVQSGRVDLRTDVYAVGITLWEMLAGIPPYADEAPLTVAYRHVHDDVPALPATRYQVPAGLTDLMLRATRRDPTVRPADAGAFLAELRGLLPVDAAAAAEAALTGLLGGVFGAERLAAVGPAVDVPEQRLRHDTLVVAPAPPPPRTAPPPPLPPPTPPPPPDRHHARRRHARRRHARRRHARRGALAAGMFAVLTVLAVVGGWYLGAGRYTTAPAVLGRDQATVNRMAAAAGVRVSYGAPAFSETVPIGAVVSQRPTPSERVPRHGTITAALSKGPERYQVPDLTGRSLAAATTALAELHLRTGAVSGRYDDTAPVGTVLDTDPTTGTALTRDSAVAVVLSRGVEPVPVPDVRGQRAEAAVGMLARAGLAAGPQEAYDERVPAGSVLSQRPAAGSNIGKGSVVNLLLSKGPQLFAVPDVTGQPRDRAVAVLTAAGFRPQVRALPLGPGTVRSQEPAGGQARRGASVTVFVF